MKRRQTEAGSPAPAGTMFGEFDIAITDLHRGFPYAISGIHRCVIRGIPDAIF